MLNGLSEYLIKQSCFFFTKYLKIKKRCKYRYSGSFTISKGQPLHLCMLKLILSFPEICLPVAFNNPTISNPMIIGPTSSLSPLSSFHYISHWDFFFLSAQGQRNKFQVFISHRPGAAYCSGIDEIFIFCFYFRISQENLTGTRGV